MIIIQISVPYFQSSHSKKKPVYSRPPTPSTLKNLSPRFCLCGEGEGGGWLYETCNRPEALEHPNPRKQIENEKNRE